MSDRMKTGAIAGSSVATENSAVVGGNYRKLPFSVFQACVFICLFPVCSLLAEDAGSRVPVKIGVLTDLSGPAAWYGRQVEVGARLAERELKAQNGDIEIIFEDSAFNTQKGLNGANKLLLLDNVDAVYVNFTPIARAVSPLVGRSGKLMIYSSSALGPARENPYSFKTYLDYAQGCEAAAREFRRRGVERMGLLKVNAEYGELCRDGTKRVYQEVDEESYDPGASVTAQLMRLRQKKVQAIMNGAYEADLMIMLKAMQDLKFFVPFATDKSCVSETVSGTFGKIMEGSLVYGLKNPSQAFLEIIRQLPGSEKLNAFDGVALPRTHIRQLYEAINSCPGREFECIRAELQKSGPDEESGFVSWKGNIARIANVVEQFREGKFEKVGEFLAE